MKMKAKIGVMLLQVKDYKLLPRNHQKLGKRQGANSFSQPLAGTNPAHTLILHFQSPVLEDNKFLLFKPSRYFALATLAN